MTKILSVFSIILFIPLGIKAQQSVQYMEDAASPMTESEAQDKHVNHPKKSSTSAAVVWSEDFGNGIPSNWTNEGFEVDANNNLIPNALCVWEYRGPNTTPSNSTGSRGQFAGSGPTIQSPTDFNGFIIFDSDYLDSDGISGNRYGGVAPAPHVGTLSTDTIDLTGYQHVEIALFSRARKYASEFKLAVSNDGGASFPDTVNLHPRLALNATSSSGSEVSANISNTAGNESMVVIKLIYDGRFSASSGPSYYYWQVDDMEIRELPKYSVQFVEWKGSYDSHAPAHDIVYPDNYAKYGHINLEQAVPINFDSNIFNYGSADLNNVRLKVDIQDATTNSTVTTLHSVPTTFLASQDSLGWDALNTSSSWTPSAVGSYNIIYSIESDSIPAAPGSYTPMDTFTIQVTDETTMNGEYSMSWGSIDNYVGTDNLANGQIIAIGERFNFPNPSKDTSGFVFIQGMTVPLSSATDTAGVIIWEVYDTTGFEFGSSGGPTGSPLHDWTFQLDASMPGTEHFFNFSDTSVFDGNGNVMPLSLPSGEAYFFLMTFIPASTDGVVRIGNSQKFLQPSGSVIVQSDAGNWFGRFGNSDNLNSPILRLNMAATPHGIGLKDYQTRNGVNTYPNPSNGEKINIEVSQGGSYNLEVVNLLGQTMHSEEITVSGNDKLIRDFSHFSTGVYLMNISNENFTNTQKLTIE